MVGRFVAAGLAALCLLRPAVVRADVGDFLGKPIGTVTVIAGGRPTTDPRLVGLVETEAGQPLRIAAVRESIAHLFSLGEYEDVRGARGGGRRVGRADLRAGPAADDPGRSRSPAPAPPVSMRIGCAA